MLVRSRANRSIIAFVHKDGKMATKIKTADEPYPGESGVGTYFPYASHLWTATNDDEALKCFSEVMGRAPSFV